MAKYALLDYDGFVCKAFYAAMARGEIDEARDVLIELEHKAIEKAIDYFKDDVHIIKIMSGHTYKKDLYPDYKAHRKKDPYISIFRDQVFEADPTILKIDNLEADDALVLISECVVGNDYIVFSDDKDLRYYTHTHCKINIDTKVQHLIDIESRYAQLLAGDSEDNIKGIPKVGSKTALKLLGRDFSLKNVAKIYKSKNIDLDETIKNIVLVAPITRMFNPKARVTNHKEIIRLILENDIEFISDLIESQLKYISRVVTDVYNEAE